MVAELRRASAALLESPPLPPAGLEELARRNARRHNRRRALTGACMAVLAVVGLTVVADGGPARDKHVVTVARDDGMLAVATSHGVLLVPAIGDPPVEVDLGGKPGRLAWSADGEWLAATVGDQLLVVRRGGTDRHRIAIEHVGGFSWSPSGSVLVVQSFDLHLYVVRPTGDPEQVLDRGGDAAWSPDGRRFAYQDFDLAAGGLHVVDVDGSDDHLLGAYRELPEAASGLQVRGWSADGSTVLYRSHDITAPASPEGRPLVAVDVSDGSTFELGPGYPQGDWITWAPTGSSVLFVSGALPGIPRDKALRRCDVVARTCVDLTPPDRVAVDPEWSPDGSHIAYVSGRGDALHLWVMAADGSDDHQVEGRDPGVRLPAWTADGGGIVYVVVRSPGAARPVLVLTRLAAEGGAPEVLATRDVDPAALGTSPTQLALLTAWSPGAKGGADRPR